MGGALAAPGSPRSRPAAHPVGWNQGGVEAAPRPPARGLQEESKRRKAHAVSALSASPAQLYRNLRRKRKVEQSKTISPKWTVTRGVTFLYCHFLKPQTLLPLPSEAHTQSGPPGLGTRLGRCLQSDYRVCQAVHLRSLHFAMCK